MIFFRNLEVCGPSTDLLFGVTLGHMLSQITFEGAEKEGGLPYERRIKEDRKIKSG